MSSNSKEYSSSYYQQNIVSLKEYKRLHYIETYVPKVKVKLTPEEKEYNKKLSIINRKIWDKKYRDNNRRIVLEHFNNECVSCGYNKDVRALQIDHINGGGSKERKNIGNSAHYYLKVIESLNNNTSNEYQILCANCNWIKRFENKE